ncbi:hypothetical protein [Streptomyces sp. SID11385]|uniref:hypothetical protein n=1 Tax=Streptomyces sp. SID11385 TaxID=2706031 RepID=UPI0013CADC2A|nr:hypothetical protein [Streptomyces sp. SID11385]NEA38813.1 hypothetical protein [Streptomyces sp. SID11385]
MSSNGREDVMGKRTGKSVAVARTGRGGKGAWARLRERQSPRRLWRRTLALGTAALLLVAAVTVTVAVLLGRDGGGRPPVPPTRARAYSQQDACLLTSASGVTAGTTAAVVWDGMRDASRDTHARVAYTPVTGAQTVENATPFLNGLFQRSCEVVVAWRGAEVAAAREAAGERPRTRFILVGGVTDGGGSKGNNTVVVAPDGEVRAHIADAVREAVAGN